jgi:hypothetical protein
MASGLAVIKVDFVTPQHRSTAPLWSNPQGIDSFVRPPN